MTSPLPTMRIVRSARLTLEPQVAAHADAMFRVLSDPAIYEFENAPPASLEWLRERFARLESRRSADGTQLWLNWVVRLPTFELAGYVQATVMAGGRASIAYELSSAHWGRGLASEAVEAMIGELATGHGVREVSAVLKRANFRSARLLERRGFTLASPAACASTQVGADELLMVRAARSVAAASSVAKAPSVAAASSGPGSAQ